MFFVFNIILSSFGNESLLLLRVLELSYHICEFRLFLLCYRLIANSLAQFFQNFLLFHNHFRTFLSKQAFFFHNMTWWRIEILWFCLRKIIWFFFHDLNSRIIITLKLITMGKHFLALLFHQILNYIFFVLSKNFS